MIIPELKLYNTYNRLLAWIEEDLSTAASDTDTILYKVLGNENVFGKFDFFTQAKELFSRKKDDPRKVECRMFFDQSRAQFPTIHINLPSEDSVNNNLGVNEGSYGIGSEGEEIYGRRYRAQYDLICTSDNSFEVSILYNLLKGATIGLFDQFSLGDNLEKLKLSGRDLNIHTHLVPQGVFFRAFSLDFEYEVPVENLLTQEKIGSLDFSGIPINE